MCLKAGLRADGGLAAGCGLVGGTVLRVERNCYETLWLSGDALGGASVCGSGWNLELTTVEEWSV